MSDIYAFGDIYDLMYDDFTADIKFYVEEAQRAEAPVLELACGTGRVLIPTAEAGVRIWGLDITPAMLVEAEKKVAQLPAAQQKLVTLELGDMRDFELDERFGLVTIPFRSFLHLMTVEDQLAALRNIHRHLKPGGRLALNFFQPDLAMIAEYMGPSRGRLKLQREWEDSESGERLVCWETRHYEPAEQLISNQWIFERVDPSGKVIDRFYRPLTLRWMYRYEFEHLAARTGFEVEALYSDFDRSAFTTTSREMVWVLRRA